MFAPTARAPSGGRCFHRTARGSSRMKLVSWRAESTRAALPPACSTWRTRTGSGSGGERRRGALDAGLKTRD